LKDAEWSEFFNLETFCDSESKGKPGLSDVEYFHAPSLPSTIINLSALHDAAHHP
jgi:hypothetical protein